MRQHLTINRGRTLTSTPAAAPFLQSLWWLCFTSVPTIKLRNRRRIGSGEIRIAAIENFARLHYRNPKEVSHDEVLQPSAGVIGWSFADVKAWDSFDPRLPSVMTDNAGSCASIAHEPEPEKFTVTCRLSDNTVRFMVGLENAKMLDALDAIDSVAT